MTGRNECARCGRPMIRREGTIPPGHVRHAAKDRCRTCYTNLTRLPEVHGTLSCGRPRAGDIDPVVVDRVLSGEGLVLNTAELIEVVTVLTRRGYSARYIAELAGCTMRTVTRHRSRVRAA